MLLCLYIHRLDTTEITWDKKTQDRDKKIEEKQMMHSVFVGECVCVCAPSCRRRGRTDLN